MKVNRSGRYLLPVIPAMVVGLIALVLIGFPTSDPEMMAPPPPDAMWVVAVIGVTLATYLVGVVVLRRGRSR